MFRSLLAIAFILSSSIFHLVAADDINDDMTQCLLTQIAIAKNDVTIGQLRQLCEAEATQEVLEIAAEDAAEEPDAVDVVVTDDGELQTADDSVVTRREFLEAKEAHNPFSITPHKPNYIIVSNNFGDYNEAPFAETFPNEDIDFQPWEINFQLSLKFPVYEGLFGGKADLYAAYTNRSFWQMFNTDLSAPFRETNHEPEIWLSFNNDYELWGIKNSRINTGLVHQSNGRSGALSRSWNRIFAEFILEREALFVSFKPWLRFSEGEDVDENPDIEDYLGNFEINSAYALSDDNRLELMIRNNLDFGDNYGAYQLGWTFPLNDRLRGYVQWFNGYGESMIDYNVHTNSIGFGIMLTDWI